MSFDLFVSPLPDSVWGKLERQTIIDVLYRDTETVDDFYSVRYADGSGAREISGLDDWAEDEDKKGLCFSHFFGGPTFMNRLYELADRLNATVFWPGDPPFIVVTRQELLARLPVELKEGDGAFVNSAAALLAEIFK